MGTAVIRLIAASSDCTLTGAAAEPGHPQLGQDAGLAAGSRRLDVVIGDSPEEAVRNCDVAIDFSAAAATAAHLAACTGRRCALVLGTTGLKQADLEQVERSARSIPLVYGRNMSVGVLVFTELARRAARLLGPEVDIEITESHHRNKVDAPSGTALQVGEAIAAELGARLDDVAVFDRFATRTPRRQGSIGFSSVRAGSIVGDHEVMFALDEEIITLRHRALERTTFARGALRAARWVVGRTPGRYGMEDVLGLDRAPGAVRA
jgi:4-hydroxy-tetrahydrodipicolinate reductase